MKASPWEMVRWALIWEKEKELCLSLDRVDIWDTTTPFRINEPEFTYRELVKLAKEKNTNKIREIFDVPYDYAVPTKLLAGKIRLRVLPGERSYI